MDVTHDRLTFIDLFAGCGGLSLGLEMGGFIPVYVNELNRDALDTYLCNRDLLNPQLKYCYSRDINDISGSQKGLEYLANVLKWQYGLRPEAGDIDLVSGGPPCQGYSGIGHRRSYAVPKRTVPANRLYDHMVQVVSFIRPKMFLFENVRGLLSARWYPNSDKGGIWEDVQEAFNNIPGYCVKASVVYAKEYGVPQNRPRVLLVGIRRDVIASDMDLECSDAVEAGFLPVGDMAPPNIVDVLSDLVDPDWENGGETVNYPMAASTSIQKRFFRRRMPGKRSLLTDHKYSKHTGNVLEKFQYMIDNSGQISDKHRTNKFAQRLLPPEWGETGPTITVTSLPDDYVHYSQPRSLTVREWARLQTFPDWYRFKGKRTTGGLRRAGNPRDGLYERDLPKYTQIGNSVPVWLARSIGEHFKKILT